MPLEPSTVKETFSRKEIFELLRSFHGEKVPSGLTGKDIGIAVLDTGVSPIALLKENIREARNFSNSPVAEDRYGHGTGVASCIQLIAPEISIYSAKVLGDDGWGTLISVLRGLDWAYNHPQVAIINGSIGGTCTPLLRAVRK